MNRRIQKKRDKIIANKLYSFLDKIRKVKGVCCILYDDVIYITLSPKPQLEQQPPYFLNHLEITRNLETRLIFEPLLIMIIDTKDINSDTDWNLVMNAFKEGVNYYRPCMYGKYLKNLK